MGNCFLGTSTESKGSIAEVFCTQIIEAPVHENCSKSFTLVAAKAEYTLRGKGNRKYYICE